MNEKLSHLPVVELLRERVERIVARSDESSAGHSQPKREAFMNDCAVRLVARRRCEGRAAAAARVAACRNGTHLWMNSASALAYSGSSEAVFGSAYRGTLTGIQSPISSSGGRRVRCQGTGGDQGAHTGNEWRRRRLGAGNAGPQARQQIIAATGAYAEASIMQSEDAVQRWCV